MRIRVLIATILATLGVASTAGAATYCVRQPSDSCPALFPGQTTTDKHADLQAALDAARADGGGTVLIGPGTYVPTGPAGFTYNANSFFDVVIRGSGVGKTVISGGTDAAVQVLVIIGTSASVLSDLTVEGTPSITTQALRLTGTTTGSTSGPTARNIAVTISNPATSQIEGIDLSSGSSLLDSSVAGGQNGNSDGIAVENGQGTVTLTDDTLVGTVGLAGQDFTAQRMRITALSTAIEVSPPSPGSGGSSVNGVLAYTTGAASTALSAFDADLTVRSGTFLYTGAGASGAALSSFVNGASKSSALTVKDSIVRGYATTVSCEDAGSGGTADTTLGWDDLHLDHPACAGPGAFDAGTGNIDADPQFANAAAGDYHLRFGSPAIDAGEPMCNAPCQGSDLDGLTRPIDGGSGQPLRDMGAFEYGHRPPTVTAGASAATASTGAPVTFTAAGSDPDGEPLSYVWAFDDGPSVAGASVTHVLPFAGSRTATVTVTDPSGLTASATVAVNVASSSQNAPPPPDRTAPVISNLSLTHTTFATSSTPTATSAATRKPVHTTPKGTSIHFTLSEKARVTITLSHAGAGIKAGGRCVAPSAKHRHGTHCDLAVGTITRRSEAARADAIAFSGRLGHKALPRGHYRLSMVATDAAGNHSKAKTATFTIA